MYLTNILHMIGVGNGMCKYIYISIYIYIYTDEVSSIDIYIDR